MLPGASPERTPVREMGVSGQDRGQRLPLFGGWHREMGKGEQGKWPGTSAYSEAGNAGRWAAERVSVSIGR